MTTTDFTTTEISSSLFPSHSHTVSVLSLACLGLHSNKPMRPTILMNSQIFGLVVKLFFTLSVGIRGLIYNCFLYPTCSQDAFFHLNYQSTIPFPLYPWNHKYPISNGEDSPVFLPPWSHPPIEVYLTSFYLALSRQPSTQFHYFLLSKPF